jgi:hypothetical protein
MIAKLTSLTPTILTAALAVIFVVAGIINIIGRGTVKTDFARWGFPDGFNIVCGGLELVGHALAHYLLGLVQSGRNYFGEGAVLPLCIGRPQAALSGSKQART